MDILVLKVALAPVLIGAASLAGRRWGQGVSGWLVGLPFTSGPIVFFVALEHGTAFAAATAIGALAGAVAQAAFCVAYAHTARDHGWARPLVAGALAFAVGTAALRDAALPLGLLLAGVLAALALALVVIPVGTDAARAAAPARWDVPLRMVVTTALVLLLTAVAPVLGPRPSGLLATFPVYATILAVFAQRHAGPGPAVRVLRGLVLGLFAFAAFFGVLAALLERVGVALAFAGAILVGLAVQGASLAALLSAARRRARRGAAPA